MRKVIGEALICFGIGWIICSLAFEDFVMVAVGGLALLVGALIHE